MMRITYIANMRLPTEKAHGAQILNACAAFAKLGHEIELVVPSRHNALTDDPFSYYGIKVRFPIRTVYTPDTVGLGPMGFLFQNFWFGLAAARRAPKSGIIYSRDELALAAYMLVRRGPVVWESHDGRFGFFARFVARRAWRLVVVTQAAKDFYIRMGIPQERILAVPNGIDLQAFAQHETQVQARARLGIPQNERIALYIGALGGWKGTDTLLEASEHLSGARVAVIGGSEAEVERLRGKYAKVLFVGARPFRELADNQAAADVLVVPNTAHSEISMRFTSPLKLIAHMASGVPIVASDLPSIRELAEGAALLVTPDDPHALAKGIEHVLADAALAHKLVAHARERVQTLDWSARARAILDHIV